jgi:hypothetical protein
MITLYVQGGASNSKRGEWNKQLTLGSGPVIYLRPPADLPCMRASLAPVALAAVAGPTVSWPALQLTLHNRVK